MKTCHAVHVKATLFNSTRWSLYGKVEIKDRGLSKQYTHDDNNAAHAHYLNKMLVVRGGLLGLIVCVFRHQNFRPCPIFIKTHPSLTTCNATKLSGKIFWL